jgi:hypothetical protein
MLRGNRGAFFAIGLVAGVALAFLFLVWSFPGFRDPAYQQERYGYAQNPETGENHPVIRPSFWETYTSPTDTYAQWLMAAFSVLATGVSIWAVRLLRETLEATRDAVRSADDAVQVTQKAFEADQRPWIDVSIKADSGIYFDDSGLHLTVIITLENVGKSPAIYTHVAALGMIPGRDGDEEGNIYHQFFTFLDRIRDMAHAQKYPGQIVFPGKTSDSQSRIVIDRRVIGQYAASAGDLVDPYVAVSVTYRSSLDPTVRETSILFNVFRWQSGEQMSIWNNVWVNETDVGLSKTSANHTT